MITNVQPGETPAGFRRRLDARLRSIAKRTGVDTGRIYRRYAIERFMARLASVNGVPWSIKGGVALDLRIGDHARFTRDIDMETSAFDNFRGSLEDAANVDMGDFTTFELRYMEHNAGSHMFHLHCEVGGQRFDDLRIEVGEPTLQHDYESIEPYAYMEFGDADPVRVPIIPAEAHFAEKLHAYTYPRLGDGNTRVKDLPDMLLLQQHCLLDPDKLRKAIETTFTKRNTHPIPETLPAPPEWWEKPFSRMAQQCGFTDTLAQMHAKVSGALQPVLKKLTMPSPKVGMRL